VRASPLDGRVEFGCGRVDVAVDPDLKEQRRGEQEREREDEQRG
jgi:hypothetical protein